MTVYFRWKFINHEDNSSEEIKSLEDFHQILKVLKGKDVKIETKDKDILLTITINR